MNKRLRRALTKLLMTKEMRWRYEERALHKTYDPLVSTAKGDERHMLMEELGYQLWDIERERRLDSDFKLIKQGRRFNIPIPVKDEKDGFWQECGGSWLLTEQGVYHLLKKIREERKDRLQLYKSWVDLVAPLITAMVGIIGALIGLAAVLRK